MPPTLKRNIGPYYVIWAWLSFLVPLALYDVFNRPQNMVEELGFVFLNFANIFLFIPVIIIVAKASPDIKWKLFTWIGLILLGLLYLSAIYRFFATF